MSAVAWQDIAALVDHEPESILDERDRRRLLAFTRRLFAGYQTAAHHLRIAAHLEAVERGELARLIVTLPPRHGKSVLVSEHFPPWFLGRHPDRRVIACSHTQLLADAFSRRARNKLADPRWPFPDVAVAGDLASVRSWDIDGHRGGYVAAGVGGPITGHGADVLLIDDPVKSAAEADSRNARDATWEWFRGTAATRLEPGAAVVVVGTRWHQDDLIGRLIASETDWTVLHLPALGEDGAALWPDRYPPEALARIREEVGSRVFAAQFQGRPSVQSGSILLRHHWRYWHRPGEPLPAVPTPGPRGGTVECPAVPLPPAFDESLMSWDLTFRETSAGSFVVGQVWGRTGADRFLLDQFRARLDFADTVTAIRAMSAKWPDVGAKLIESAANGPAVVSALRHAVPGLIEVRPEGGKESRANAASAVLESGNVYLPHPSLASWVDGFVDECADFPFGAHDDQVDAFSQAMHRFGLGAGTVGTSYLGNGRAVPDGLPRVDVYGNDLPAGGNGRWGAR